MDFKSMLQPSLPPFFSKGIDPIFTQCMILQLHSVNTKQTIKFHKFFKVKSIYNNVIVSSLLHCIPHMFSN